MTIQSGILNYQGQREVRLSQQGAMRHEVFQVELIGAVSPAYSPVAPFESQVKAIVACRFGIGFIDKPLLKPNIALKWQDTNGDLGQAHDPDYEPVITACVMNWKRAKGHLLYLGADVSIRVYDHPFEAKMITRLVFMGPAIATPVGTMSETEDTTVKV